MKKTLALLSLAAACPVGTATAQDNDFHHEGNIKRVLLISVDGMHAVDFANCANGIDTVNNGEQYCPALAALSKTGVNYVAANTSKPSDSFPGLTAIITGGSPALTGVYYDVAYSRNYDAPAKTTGNGVAAGPCTPNSPPTGTTTEYEEGIDIDQTQVNGGAPGAALTDGGITSIDPQRLVRDPSKGCKPVFPWEFVRANSIFSVIHQAGGYTAWSDKHPAYASVASGIGPSALDDFYAPEINSNVIGLPGVTTPTGISCGAGGSNNLGRPMIKRPPRTTCNAADSARPRLVIASDGSSGTTAGFAVTGSAIARLIGDEFECAHRANGDIDRHFGPLR